MEIIDSDHVQMDIMYQVFENGALWCSGLEHEFLKKQLIVIDYILILALQLRVVKSFKMLSCCLWRGIVIIAHRLLQINDHMVIIGHLLRMVLQVLKKLIILIFMHLH